MLAINVNDSDLDEVLRKHIILVSIVSYMPHVVTKLSSLPECAH